MVGVLEGGLPNCRPCEEIDLLADFGPYIGVQIADVGLFQRSQIAALDRPITLKNLVSASGNCDMCPVLAIALKSGDANCGKVVPKSSRSASPPLPKTAQCLILTRIEALIERPTFDAAISANYFSVVPANSLSLWRSLELAEVELINPS